MTELEIKKLENRITFLENAIVRVAEIATQNVDFVYRLQSLIHDANYKNPEYFDPQKEI